MYYEIHKAGIVGPETLLQSFTDFPTALESYSRRPDAWAIVPVGRPDELEPFGNLKSINPRYSSGCYVLKSGDGVTCLGFAHADRKIQEVAKWIGELATLSAMPGTPEHYAAYLAIMAAGAAFARRTGQRCPADLVPELVPFEGKRVRVTYPDGTLSRFRVGKSTGWMPCHLEIKGRSDGGCAVYFPAGSTVEAE